MRQLLDRQNFVVTFGVCVLLLACVTSSGCAALASNLLHAIYGHEQKPKYEGLKKQRIAIICSNESGILSDDVTNTLAMTVRSSMVPKLKKATLLNQTEVAQKAHLVESSNEDAAVQIGKEVNADVVIRIDVSKMSLYDGKTMYRGVSDIEVELIDIKTKEVLFEKSLPSFTYPESAAISTTEMDLQKFRKMYVKMIGERISRLFVSHQMGADIAGDARILQYQ